MKPPPTKRSCTKVKHEEEVEQRLVQVKQEREDVKQRLVQVKQEKEAAIQDAEMTRILAYEESKAGRQILGQILLENSETQQRLVQVKQEKSETQQKLTIVKQERDAAKHDAAMAKMLADALVVEKEHLEDNIAFQERVLKTLVEEKQNLENRFAVAADFAARAHRKMTEAELMAECPLCNEPIKVGRDFIAFVPCGHGMCEECIMTHGSSKCHSCERKVKKLLRVRK